MSSAVTVKDLKWLADRERAGLTEGAREEARRLRAKAEAPITHWVEFNERGEAVATHYRFHTRRKVG
ncbi:MAG: hypothetical protein WAS54_06095 [Scrofimicrobium sp.]